MVQASDDDFSQASGASGTSVRTGINDYVAALLTKNSGPSEPATTFPGMDWLDTSGSPVEWYIRNQANDDWDLFATIDASTGITILNQEAAVVALNNSGAFTEPQTIDKSGAAGSLTLLSDLDTGVVAFLDLAGENAANEDTVGVSVDARMTTNTDGAEDFELDLGVMRSGSMVVRATLGSTFAVTGTLNATTLQQSGTAVATLIENAIKAVGVPTTSSTSVAVPSAVTAGDINTFTGSSTSTWTISSGTAGDVYGVCNDGSANITFAASGTTLIGGTTLGQQKVCTVWYRTSTRVFLFGGNT